MVVRLRLSRKGTRNNPFYHVVAINDSKPRDARPIEKLGEYDPIPRAPPRLATPSLASKPGHGALMTSGLEPKAEQQGVQKRLEWNEDRIKHWLGLGAQPSKPVARLLDRAGLVPEGVHYKGIYRPPPESQMQATPPTASKSKESTSS